MGQIKDITGQRFGKLVVLKQTDKRYHRQMVWKCQCDCGNITEVAGGSLRSGHTQSCGCSNKQSKNTIDETGNRYGNLVVIQRDFSINTGRQAHWLCKCDCGNIRTVTGVQLRNGNVISCQQCALKRGIEKRKNMDIQYNSPVKDHRGERFGKLIALEPTSDRKNGKVVWKCQCDCGNITYVSSNCLVSGTTQSCGCLINKSVGENYIEQLLKVNNIPYQKQVTFSDCLSSENGVLRYDFAILDENNQIIKLIEFDGEQHFTPIKCFGGENGFKLTKKHDEIKNNYAKNKGIPLIRIPFTRRYDLTLIDLTGNKYCV